MGGVTKRSLLGERAGGLLEPAATRTVTRPMDQPSLPPHVDEAVQAIARLHAEHHRTASPIDHLIDLLTGIVGSPAFLVFVAGWIGTNALGVVAVDPPPFVWLVGLLGLMAVLMGALLMTSQRRADRLGVRRDQLNLELTILADQKTRVTRADVPQSVHRPR